MRKITTEKVYFTKRKCYKCGKRILFTKNKHSILCDKCYDMAQKTSTLVAFPKNYSSKKYKRVREELISIAGRCALCGTKKSLTAHHIGGQTNLGLTCLCDDCHKAYERWHKNRY